MHLDTVLKPATGFEASTKGPDTRLFKKITHAYTHIQTDSVIYTQNICTQKYADLV